MKITESKSSLRRLLKYIDASIILHNMLIDFNDEEEIPEEWYDWDDFSDVDDDARAPLGDDDELNCAIPRNAATDERRRQLTNYLCEFYVM